MNRKIITVFLCFLLVISVVGCTQEIMPGEEKITVEDQLGREVEIEKSPDRIVSLAPSVTEILFAIGERDNLVGVSDFCNYPPEALEIESVGEYPPSEEKIAELNPDLIIGVKGTEELEQFSKEIGASLIILDPGTVDEVYDSIELLGKITNSQNQAEQVIDEIESNIEATEELHDEEKKTLYLLGVDEGLWTAGSGTFLHDMIVKAGGENIASDLDGYNMIEEETVLEEDPEVIILSEFLGLTIDDLEEREEWKNIDAVQEGNVFKVENEDILVRPGPRIDEGVGWLVEKIHGEDVSTLSATSVTSIDTSINLEYISLISLRGGIFHV